MNATSFVEPVLQAPGAGLPPAELWIARLLFRVRSRISTRENSGRLLDQQTQKIVGLAEGIGEKSGRRRILIRRLAGMEDSSRYWSVFMTVEHVRMVNLAVAAAIRELGQRKVSAQAANTASVKPSPEVDESAVPGLVSSCSLIARQARHLDDFKTRCTYAHPWFGSLNAGEWYFLAGFHAELHRKQIQLILRGLKGRSLTAE